MASFIVPGTGPGPGTGMDVVDSNKFGLNHDKAKYDGKCLIYSENTSGISTKEKDEDEDVKRMKVADTIHDMWNLERGEDVQIILNDLANKFSGIDGNPGMAVWIQELFNGNIIQYKFEPKANSYFEARYHELPSLCRSRIITDIEIALQSIVEEGNDRNGSDRGKIWNTIINNSLINAIRISLPQQQEKKDFYDNPLNAKGLNYTADFIMTFCGKPLPKIVVDERPLEIKVVFPIDATAGKLPDIFRGINNGVYTLATAMTIADSAGGGLNEKKDKKKRLIHFNKKYEPFYFPFNDTTHQKYYINSEYFTKDKLRMYYRWPEENGQFSNKNQSGIKFGVEITKTQFKEVEFGLNLSGKPVSGASVATLRELMIIIYENRGDNVDGKLMVDVVNAKTEIQEFQKNGGFDGQLDLTYILLFLIDEFKDDLMIIIGFLCDYKRAGDYEQINSTKLIGDKDKSIHPIFCTGDELCALYSRSEKLNTAWSHGNYLDLFRFPTGVVDEIALQSSITKLQYDILMRYLEEYFEYERDMKIDLTPKTVFKIQEKNIINVFNILNECSEKSQTILDYYKGPANKIAIEGLFERIKNYIKYYEYIKQKHDDLIKNLKETMSIDTKLVDEKIKKYRNKNLIEANNVNNMTESEIIIIHNTEPNVIDFFKDVSRFTPVFEDVTRMKKYLEINLKNRKTIETIIKDNIPGPFKDNIPGPLVKNNPVGNIVPKYIKGVLLNYNLEDCNKFYEFNKKIKHHNVLTKRFRERDFASIKQVLEEYKTTVISILETYLYNIQTAENFENDNIEKIDTFGKYEKNVNGVPTDLDIDFDSTDLDIDFDYISHCINDIKIDENKQIVGKISYKEITNEIIKNFIDEVFTLNQPRETAETKYGGNPGKNYNDKDSISDEIKTKFFEDELLTAFINISDECLNFFHGINRKKKINEIKNTNEYILSLGEIDDKITEKFFNSICVSFNNMINKIINNLEIEIGDNIDISTLPNSLFGLIAITNIEDVSEKDNQYAFNEYDSLYTKRIHENLQKYFFLKNTRDNYIFIIISYIIQLQLQIYRPHYLRITILLFFAISKNYFIDSDYVLNKDYITNSNLDIKDRNEKDYSLEKTYYDPNVDNILSNESHKLISDTFSLNSNVSEYLKVLMDGILIPFFKNISDLKDEQIKMVLDARNDDDDKNSKKQRRGGGNSKKNRRTKKKTSKTNKKYTRKVHPKKHRKTKRKSKK
jgi:hypothetical protein